MSAKLYAVATEQKSPMQLAREAVSDYRKRSEIDYGRVRKATIRHGAGMRWLPSWYSFWLKASVIRPERGEIQQRLYGKR